MNPKILWHFHSTTLTQPTRSMADVRDIGSLFESLVRNFKSDDITTFEDFKVQMGVHPILFLIYTQFDL